MFPKTNSTLKRVVNFYTGFIKPNIKNKKYKKITKLFGGVTKYILFKKPYILIIETGTVCNLDCPTCPTPREIVVGARTSGNMDLDSFKKIINNSYKSFSVVLLYWSNEPLLNKNIADMVRYCNRLNLYTFISTNVMLLNEQIIKELIEAGLDELLVCIDGFSPETFETFRKGAKFDTVKKNIETACKIKKELNALNPWIEIQYVENRQNANEIDSCMEWAKEAGVDGFRIQSLYISRHLSDFGELRNEFYTEKNWQERGEKDSTGGICKNADSTVCVLLNGQLTLCCYDITGEYSYGNLLNNSFTDIAETEKYIGIKGKGKRRELKICKKC